MKILMLAAEVAPFVKIGGLSQVIYFLSKKLSSLGHDVRIFMPSYGVIDKKKFPSKIIYEQLVVPFGKLHKNKTSCNIRLLKKKSKSPLVYFLENREYYEMRANVFAYKDDHVRFLLLSLGCLEWLLAQKKQGDWVPDLIHCHDWHTGYFIDEARRNKKYSAKLRRIPLLFTAHNFKYQGNLGFRYLAPKLRDNGKALITNKSELKLKYQNPLLRGMLYADWINTVSENHALEVLTEKYAEGLEKYTKMLRGKLSGILNGLDNTEFNPNTDPLIASNYSLRSLFKRKANKIDLQKTFGLPENSNIPLFAFVGRFSKQKGIDILLSVIKKVLNEHQVQFIFLGGGNAEYKNSLTSLQKKYPEAVSAHIYPDFKLPRKVFAGSDVTVIPSFFEPGGIVALEALRYGSVPLVHSTGGLADSIKNFNPHTQIGNGFVFNKFSSWSLFATIIRAIENYKQPLLWNKLIKNCMRSNFSWKTINQH